MCGEVSSMSETIELEEQILRLTFRDLVSIEDGEISVNKETIDLINKHEKLQASVDNYPDCIHIFLYDGGESLNFHIVLSAQKVLAYNLNDYIAIDSGVAFDLEELLRNDAPLFKKPDEDSDIIVNFFG
ncbi:hypothetical protein B9Q03_05915 [Candidatus Marsarchaeota G2 archaeon OSP_D]|uniref:Uncharacterized protein n=1 Tax=Candidatus Marsarchaeota G2 archaeon OSP_D TaxID=1978157 RepID=A0A2R6AWT0_9ARCH|nr:MAG: hypothetical protein B9Q03_05915 [Candidatus Marsarchaeota G2 archaeon OSP_D]